MLQLSRRLSGGSSEPLPLLASPIPSGLDIADTLVDTFSRSALKRAMEEDVEAIHKCVAASQYFLFHNFSPVLVTSLVVRNTPICHHPFYSSLTTAAHGLVSILT